ncbi:glycosyltransferase [Ramlibacter sp. WS9]|uniref:glycosyltransferase n=1 Tax=Ramlibacter sp. WS9 TaxID=1882741 RepID=UPI001141ADB1|nr:glycosyltransferase [Ramlibacter sp. WS9]ROZ66359.1 glycosyltransferase [Ramlibacter sp. WS9]
MRTGWASSRVSNAAPTVLHVPYGYMPDASGGTEVFVAALARELRAFDWSSMVAAPGASDRRYEWEGVDVRRFAVSPGVSLDAQYGEGDRTAAAAFAAILTQCKPDIVHFHALSPAVSARAMQAVAAKGIPLVFTYHTPTVSCVRGSMLRWGSQACDGRMRPRLCSACALHGKGLPKPVAALMAALPHRLLAWIGRTIGKGRTSTALQMPLLVRNRHQTARSAWAAADRIVAVCDWVHKVLLLNGIAPAKLLLSRQGLPSRTAQSQPPMQARIVPSPAFSPANPLRLAYFGRLDPTKGIEVLVAAVKLLPNAPVALDIYGVGEVPRDDLAKAIDGRIRFHPPLASHAVPDAMKAYHLITVPSVCMETGPLVAYEALASGVPVLGSALGGIAEVIRDGTDGRLVSAGSPKAWADALAEVLQNPQLLETWRSSPRATRTMGQVAAEMADLYRQSLHGGKAQVST